MSYYKWLLDAGHGGMLNGRYVTAPRKMFKFPDFVIYEGVINRAITNKVAEKLESLGIEYKIISDPIEDDSLALRVRAADNAYTSDKRVIFLSIHSNAGAGSGFEIFTSKGQTKSDKIANIFCEVYKKHFPDRKFRSDALDGDDDKEEDFYVLRKTDCPAVLVENLFFDNHAEAVYLMSEQGQTEIARCIVDCINECERLKPVKIEVVV